MSTTTTRRALNHTEKVILAYSRTVSGTLSIIASILIINKIYRYCQKKHSQHQQQQQQLVLLNGRSATANDSAVGAAAAAGTSSASGNTSAVAAASVEPTNSILQQQSQSQQPQQQQQLDASLEDDGYTPLPINNNNTTNSINNNELNQSTSPTTSTTHTTPTTTTTTSILSLYSLLSHTTVYQRLLMGTSIYDLFHCFWAALSTLPVPASSGAVFGHGTTATCSVQGFFVQLSAATPIYFAALTFYFMCKVCYNLSDDVLSKRYEIYFHLLPFIVAFGGGIIGVSLKVFNPIALPELGCWVAPYPIGCYFTNTCTRGYKIAQYSDWYAWCFAFMWFFLSFIVVSINTTLIYCTIYYRERTGNRQRNTIIRGRIQNTNTQMPTSYVSSTIRTTTSQNKSNTIMSEIINDHDHDNNNNERIMISNINDQDDINHANEDDDDKVQEEEEDVDGEVIKNQLEGTDDVIKNQPQRHDYHQYDDENDNERNHDFEDEFLDSDNNFENENDPNNNNNNNNPTVITPPITDTTSYADTTTYNSLNHSIISRERDRHRDRQQQHRVNLSQQRHRASVRTSRIAAAQCVLYVSTALFTTVWSVMPWIGKKLQVSSKWRFFFAFMFNIFNPMQGFFTLIIFIRLQYLRLRVSEPNWSRIQCIRFCLFSPDAK